MSPSLQLNRDYLVFVESGLLFTMATASWAWMRADTTRPWRWFSLFAFAQAVQAWLEIVRIDADTGTAFVVLELAIRTAGVFGLLEFSLRLLSIKATRVKPWLIRALLAGALVAAPGLNGIGGINSLLCVAATAIAAWTGVRCWRGNLNSSRETAQYLRLFAWLLPTYVLLALLPAGSSLVSNLETALDLPLQLVRGAIGALLAFVVYRKSELLSQGQLPTALAASWRRHRLVCTIIVWSIVFAGWLTTERVGRAADAAMRERILLRTQLAAASVDATLVRDLAWGDADLAKRSYQHLKELMKSLRSANRDMRFVMLTGLREGRSYFLVDSEAPNSKDYSPPGQFYQEAAPEYLAAFAQRTPYAIGPVTDRWGTWVIASVPFLDLGGNRAINVEIDIAASDWDEQIRSVRLPVILITLLISLLIIVSFHTQERLRESATRIALSEQRSSSLVEGSPDCVQMFDLAGRYLAVNRNGLVALGLTEAKVIGRPFVDIWPAPARVAIQAAVDATLQGESVSLEADYVRPDGRVVTWRFATNPVRDQEGRVCSFVGICVDLTERKNTELALLAAKEAAEAATKVKSEFLAVMSHELRTPLAGVISMLDLLHAQSAASLRQKYTAAARDSAEMLLRILDDILDTAKIEAGKLSLEAIAFRPKEEFLGLLETARFRAETKGLAFHYDLSPALPEVMIGDPTRLRQVLGNLQNNALKFTESGSVQVQISAAPLETRRVQLRIAVRDTGGGILEAARVRLFSKFEQADTSTTRRYGGTGLGLAIVKALAELMHGEVTVESTVGVGSTFTFSAPLPIGEATTLPSTSISGPPTALPRNSIALRIICAEDDAVNRMAADALLRDLGHHVEFAADGQIALERLRTAPCDLVLMDNRMPVLDGLHATRLIRDGKAGAIDPEIYIVAATANASDTDRATCLAHGMDDFLTKPLRRSALHAALERAIKHLQQRGIAFSKLDASPALEVTMEEAPPTGLSEAQLLAALDEQQTRDKASDGAVTLPDDIAANVAQVFAAETPNRFAALRAALAERDAASLACSAHALASSSRYVDARRLSHLAAAMEILADAGRVEETAPLLALAEAEFALLDCIPHPATT